MISALDGVRDLLSSDSLLTISKEPAQSAKSICAENLFKMRARCVDLRGATWVMHPSVRAELNRHLRQQESTTIRSIFGIPLTESVDCSELGTCGDILLVVKGRDPEIVVENEFHKSTVVAIADRN